MKTKAALKSKSLSKFVKAKEFLWGGARLSASNFTLYCYNYVDLKINDIFSVLL